MINPEQLKAPKYDSLRRAFWSYIIRVLHLEHTEPTLNPTNYTNLNEVNRMLAKRIEAYDQELIEQGVQQGIRQGVQQEELLGVQKGQYQMLISILEDRFGKVPEQLMQHIKTVSSEELLRLSKRALHVKSLDELND